MSSPARWTLITGASSGIGRDLARVFARQGHALILTARRRERLEALAEELRATYSVEVRIIVADLEQPDSATKIMDELEEQDIALDTLVNNAGFGLRGRFHTLPFERQMAMIAVNVTALTALSRLVLPSLIARKTGGILNVASTAAFQAGPGMAVYYATKAYVLSLSEALYEEAQPHGVTVSAFCPGPVDTEFSSIADVEGKRRMRFGTMSSPEAAEAAFAGYLKGQAVVVPKASNILGALGAKLLPRALSRRAAGRLQRGKAPVEK